MNKTNSKKVTLWTRQDIKSVDELKKNRVIRIEKKHLIEKFGDMSDYIIKLYSWFVEEASKKIPKPEEVEFPIWCATSKESTLGTTKNTVVYILEVDESEIIYFDSLKWDRVLNHLYVPKDAKDEEEYIRNIKNKGFKDEFSVMDSNIIHFYPEEKKKIIDSWTRVFTIDKWDPFRVQANIWEIRPDMIKEIVYHEE